MDAPALTPATESLTLFDVEAESGDAGRAATDRALGHWPSPVYFGELLFESHFGHLPPGAIIVEPSAGEGNLLSIIPDRYHAVGVELSPQLAAQAAQRTGRRIIVGDFRNVELGLRPDAVFGNPPFRTELVDAFLSRSHALLPAGGIVGFILPVYMIGNAARVRDFNLRWSIEQELIPRELFGKVTTPLAFVRFVKDGMRRLVGFASFLEAADVLHNVDRRFRRIMERGGRRGPWREVVVEALRILGGEAPLARIYALIESRGLAVTRFWREKIRQVCGELATRGVLVRLTAGTFALYPQEIV